jgi:hypothetical protein
MRPTGRYIASIGAGTVAAAVVFGVVTLVNSRYIAPHGRVLCSGVSRFGWALPVLILAVTGVLAAVLIAQPGWRRSGGDLTGRQHKACPRCKERVLRDWLLCPFCGAQLEDFPHQEPESGAAEHGSQHGEGSGSQTSSEDGPGSLGPSAGER